MVVITYSCSNPKQTTTVKGDPNLTHAVSCNGIYVYVDASANVSLVDDSFFIVFCCCLILTEYHNRPICSRLTPSWFACRVRQTWMAWLNRSGISIQNRCHNHDKQSTTTGAVSKWTCHLISTTILVLKIRLFRARLTLAMGIPIPQKTIFFHWNKALHIYITYTCTILQVQPGDVLFVAAYSHGEYDVAVPYDIGDPEICGTSYKATFQLDPPMITNVTAMSECWMLSLQLELWKTPYM